MLSLILLLAAAPPPQQTEQAFIRSCDMTDAGWVCRYALPAMTAVPRAAVAPPPPVLAAAAVPEPPAAEPAGEAVPPAPVAGRDPMAEAEARLILRCAEASWFSLCLPGERRQARALKAAAQAREARRLEVTRLLSENRCEDAVRAALQGGDMPLAREARAFCAAPAATN